MTKVTDIHSHIFDVRYLPFEEMVIQFSLEDLNVRQPVAEELASYLSQIFNEILYDNVSVDSGLIEVLSLLDDANDEAVKDSVTDAVFSRIIEKLLGLLLKGNRDNSRATIERSDFVTSLVRLKNLHVSEAVAGEEMTEEGLVTILAGTQHQDEEKKIELTRQFKGPLKWAMKQTNLEKYLRFLLLMLQTETNLADYLLHNTYNDTQNLVLHVHHMMDMEKAYRRGKGRREPGKPPYYDYKSKQVGKMAEVFQKNKGKLLGFVAFDPRRTGAYEICEDALNRGFIGVKMYPPLGYRPDDFAHYPALHRLYTLCVRKGIPIMTHCTPSGFEGGRGWGLNSHPVYWEEVLSRESPLDSSISYSDLKLCFGHAGGGNHSTTIYEKQLEEFSYLNSIKRAKRYEDPKTMGHDWGDEEIMLCKYKLNGWYAGQKEWESEAGYPRKVVELCTTYPNVYCDFSHLIDVIPPGDDKNPNEFRKKFESRFKEEMERDASYPFADKVMFGSDWHMKNMIDRTADFLMYFEELFMDKTAGLSAHKDKFFSKNALQFLGIREYLHRYEEYGNNVLDSETVS